MARSSVFRLSIFVLAPTAAALALVFLGLELGRHLATRDLVRSIAADARNGTLGDVVDLVSQLQQQNGAEEDLRAEFGLAFLDPASAAREMGDYSFAVPMVPSPFVGHAPAPGRHANATISAQQFRHDAELAVPKPAGVVRIFVTGGSTAFGAGAPSQSRTITGYLQELFDEHRGPRRASRYEIVNAAAPAWASTQERLWIEQRLSELEPDLVVSLSGINDVHWGALGREVSWFRSYTDQHYFQLLNLVRAEVGLEPFRDVTVRAAGRVAPQTIARNLEKNVALATAALALGDVPYVFALQPMIAVTAKALSEREQQRKDFSLLGPGVNAYFRESFEAVRVRLGSAQPPGFHFVDLTGVFDADTADSEIFLDSYHFGDRGNRLIARELFRELLPLLPAAVP